MGFDVSGLQHMAAGRVGLEWMGADGRGYGVRIAWDVMDGERSGGVVWMGQAWAVRNSFTRQLMSFST